MSVILPCGCKDTVMCKTHEAAWWARHDEALKRQAADGTSGWLVKRNAKPFQEELTSMETSKPDNDDHDDNDETPAGGPAPAEAKSVSSKKTRSKKQKAKKNQTKGAPKTAKKASSSKPAVDGLGRENTVSRTICERLVAGDTNEQAVKAARKKFPDKKIPDGYGAWYRNHLVKRGLLKKEAAK